MVMIPLNFLIVLPLLSLALWLWIQRPEPFRSGWLILFLIALGTQLILLGIRYGYGADWVISVQALTGSIVPVLGYFAFRNPEFKTELALHLLPIAAIWFAAFFIHTLIDATLALVTLCYCVALFKLGLRGSDGLPWAPLQLGRLLSTGLWATVVSLFISGTVDAIIAFDFFTTGGENTRNIAAAASALVMLLLPAWLGYAWFQRRRRKAVEPGDADQKLLDELDEILVVRELYRDPELTLLRLSRRMGVPARQISSAVNQISGKNVSQYVNDCRIKAACKALRETKQTVTSIMLDSGFYTKSNFNREFRRVTGTSPSQWREQTNRTPEP